MVADVYKRQVFPLAFDGMPADDAEIILNPSGKFVQGGPDGKVQVTMEYNGDTPVRITTVVRCV